MFKEWRIKTVFGIFFILFLLVIWKLVQWQIINYDKYRVLAEQQRTINMEMSSPRGSIYSADGSTLAYNQPAWGVYVNVKDIRDGKDSRSKYEIIRLISPVLEISEDILDERINMSLNYVPLKHKVSEDTVSALKEIGISSLRYEQEEKRVYPEGRMASHIIGFVGKDDIGRESGRYGIEGYFDGDLSGKKGFVTAEKDTFGRLIVTGELESIVARKGRDITLTIDRGLQRIVEKGIRKGVEDFEARSGTVIVMDPKTGAILAMANYPNYDPNEYWNIKDSSILNNLAVSHVYEFGSVSKIFTAAAVVEEDSSNLKAKVEAHTGCIEILDKTVCNWNRQNHGEESLVEVLQKSCNVGTYYFARKIGSQKLYDYLLSFGIGKASDITLQEDATSFLKDWRKWSELDLATASFGQAISATPIQIISGISAIANGGERMQPHIVSTITDDDRIIEFEPQIASTPVSKDTADSVTDMMVEVMKDGGFQWYVQDITNYHLAGKTGSGQVPYQDRPGYDPTKVNTTFVAYDARPERKFIMLVGLQEPQVGGYASDTAVPVWVSIFKELSVYMGITPIE
jgi:cell division protein FtsI/penicillin-binding protein 2